MQKQNFKTFIDGVRNDFKISIDDLFNAIKIIKEDVEILKNKVEKLN